MEPMKELGFECDWLLEGKPMKELKLVDLRCGHWRT